MRKNFWPRVRDYREAHDLLDLRRRWLDETCNVRIHGTFEKDGIWVYYRLAANLAPATRKLLAELVA